MHMTRRQILFFIGILIVVTSLSGLTPNMRQVLSVFYGVLVIIIAYFTKKDGMNEQQVVTPVYSESRKETVINQ